MKSALALFFIHRVVAWVSGLSADDFLRVRAEAGAAISKFTASADKAQYVRDFISKSWPQLGGWAVNLLLELAVATIKKQ